jgi:hypothetical protein
MESGISGGKPFISVVARPGSSLDEFAVRWRLGWKLPDGKVYGGKQGIVKVSRGAGSPLRGFDDVAELAALHHLLVEREVLGEGRGGNGLFIFVSKGSIRKMMLWYKAMCRLPISVRRASLKAGAKSRGLDIAALDGNTKVGDLPIFGNPHLVPYGRFLFGRFFDASIEVSKDVSWINAVVDESRITHVVVGKALTDVIFSPNIGPVAITVHVIEQFAKRLNCMEYQDAWRAVSNMLRAGSLRVVKQESESQSQDGKARGVEWIHPETKITMVIGQDNGRHVLITSYRAGDFDDYHKRNSKRTN